MRSGVAWSWPSGVRSRQGGTCQTKKSLKGTDLSSRLITGIQETGAAKTKDRTGFCGVFSNKPVGLSFVGLWPRSRGSAVLGSAGTSVSVSARLHGIGSWRRRKPLGPWPSPSLRICCQHPAATSPPVFPDLRLESS